MRLITTLLSAAFAAKWSGVLDADELALPHAAFIARDSQGRLLVTEFGQAGIKFAQGTVAMVEHALEKGAKLADATVTNIVDKTLLWPNKVSEKPDNTDILVIPDGFIPPGREKGAIYAMSIAKGQDSLFKITGDNGSTFYHYDRWVDLDGDGDLDLITAGTTGSGLVIRSFSGSLVWFENPGDDVALSQTWKQRKIVDGPDAGISPIYEVDDETVVIFAAEFFAKKITANVIEKNGGKLRCQKVIDSSFAWFYVEKVDINDDGVTELLASTHEGDPKNGKVSAFTIPDDLCNGEYTEHVLAQGQFVAHKSIMPGNASPGFVYPFKPAEGEQTHIFIEGDNSHDVYLLSPKSTEKGHFEFELATIGDCGGTTGGCALHDFDNDGVVEAICSNNDKSKLQLIRFQKQEEMADSDAQVGLVMFGGAQVAPDQYVDFLAQIKEEAKGLGLDVISTVVSFPLNVPAIGSADAKCAEGLETLKKAGFSGDNVFYIGHSLGGAMLQDAKTAQASKGVALFGSFLLRKYRNWETLQVDYPAPTLTIAGELDGLARLERQAEGVYAQKDQFAEHPAVVVPGLAHSQYQNGTRSFLEKKMDLQPEIEDDEARRTVAKIVASWLQQRITGSGGAALAEAKKTSDALIQPLVDAFLESQDRAWNHPQQIGGAREGDCGTVGPVAGHPGLCPGSGVKAVLEAQSLIGHDMDKPLEISNQFVLLTQQKVEHHLPVITNDTETGAINVTTYVQAYYSNKIGEEISSFDTGFFPSAPLELGSKMASRQCLFIRGEGKTDTPFSVDDPDFCQQANQMIFDTTLEKLPEATKARYEKYGQKLTFGPSVRKIAGPLWLNGRLQYNEVDENTVEVISPSIVTEIDYWQSHFHIPRPSWIPDPGCYHYCKLIAPSKVAEWVYVDSLRKQRSLSAEALVSTLVI